MEDCIFCKIISKKIPSSIVFEDRSFFAFMDIQPVSKGHVLVVPKEHHRDLFELRGESLSSLMEVVQQIAAAVKVATGCDGVNIGMNNGRAAGQAVFHAHIHVIPRFDDDGLRMWPGKKYDSPDEMETTARSIKDAMKKDG